MHRNNFDALRLAAALAVMVSHVFPLSDRVEPSLLGRTLGTYAVFVFFVMSGFLVTGSWKADPSACRFGVRRILRIAPAYVVTVAATWLAFRLAGAENFAANPMPTVNGSLWTIPLEVQCYAVLLLLCVLTRFGPACFIVVAFVTQGPFAEFAGYFAAGALMSEYRVLRSLRVTAASLLVGVVLIAAGHPYLGALLVIAPLTILIGAAPGITLPWGDISYGTYLWAYPLQQVVILLLDPQLPVPVLLIAAIAITLPVAWLSWRLVERPAIRWKPRGVSTSGASPISSPSHQSASLPQSSRSRCRNTQL